MSYSPLINLTKTQLKYVEDLWHHATLTYYNLVPSNDTRYNDMDLDLKEINEIINKYGVLPSKNHWYWSEYKLVKNNKMIK